jgi:hypothetical protein
MALKSTGLKVSRVFVKVSKYARRKPHLEGKSPQNALTEPFLLTTWHEAETPDAREQKQARCKPRFRSHSQIWCGRIRTPYLVGLNEVNNCEKDKSIIDLPSDYDVLTCQWAKYNKLSVRALKDKARKVEVRRWLGGERHGGGRDFANSRTISPVQP